MTRTLTFAALVILTGSAAAFDTGRAGFSVRINVAVVPYDEFAVFVLPGEPVDIEVLEADENVMVRFEAVRLEARGPRRWRLAAPAEPGIYPLDIANGAASMRINLFVMIPAERVKNGRLNGYRIGSYPVRPLRGDPVYLPPRGFVEMTGDNAGTRLSPHFTLGQFPAKQAGGYPKYLVLREALLLKLELLLEEANRRGIRADTFVIMSGYRTPYYNASIGNVPSSRHVYGGAADIYIDVAPKDGVMDDLNGDGKLDFRDAQRLYGWANTLFAHPANRNLAGGLGVYRRNPAHGPFLHVDARGRRARWGALP